MNRRTLLKLVAMGMVGHTLDLDKLLWVPGQKKIFLPPIKTGVHLSDIEYVLRKIYTREAIQQLFNREDVLFQAMTRHETKIYGRSK